jgi:hypothetical protein
MSDLTPPAWVTKRDGRLVPFEADKISRALFAAGEDLGKADAFLARELADGVVHFLAAEAEGATPSTAQVEETVVKVVRELGHPPLAESFASFARRRRCEDGAAGRPAPRPSELTVSFPPGRPLAEVLADCARTYTLQTVFTRDLVAVREAGLLALDGLETPGEMTACVLGPPVPAGADLVASLAEARRFAARLVALDGPEHAPGPASGPGELADRLSVGLRLTGLSAVVNLNCATPPSWADDLAEGPLFPGRRRAPDAGQLARLADAFLDELLLPERASLPLRVDWHLAERDFLPEARARLLGVVRRALAGAAVGFVFDRPRRPVALGEGLDRRHPAVLLAAGLNLPALARQPTVAGDPGRFLHRLGSLARLALSAAVQKRDFLRNQEKARPPAPGGAPAVTSGFLLDRARLMATPLGLDHVVRTFGERGLCAGGQSLDLGRQVALRLRDVLRQDGRSAQMDTCLDGPFSFRLADAPADGAESVAGLTPWGPDASPKAQLRAGGALHAVAEHGTLALFLPPDEVADPEPVADWLRGAWQQTDLVRLRLLRPAATQRSFI